MIRRLAEVGSVALHLMIIAMIGRASFAVKTDPTPVSGMEIEVIDDEYAMLDFAPDRAEAPSAAAPVLAEQSAKAINPDPVIQPLSGADAIEPVLQEVAAVAVAAAAELPDPVAAEEPRVQSIAQTSPAIVPAPAPRRLNAASLAQSLGTSTPSDKPARLNSAAIGTAIGRAAPRGVPGLTFRQKVDLAQMVRSQVIPCWNPPVTEATPLVAVKLRFKLDRKGQVAGRPIVSGVTGGTSANAPYVNLLANSGRRAILLCAPLDLPSELYEAWAEVEVEFDPRDLK